MITLYDCAFSPFARKVRLVLEYKDLQFEAIDGLRKENRKALEAVNPRGEVPALIDGDIVVVNSSHIVAYLEDAYPHNAVLPSNLRNRANARHWERMADTVLDPIVVDVSLWSWANRSDSPPDGLIAAAQRDLDAFYSELESALEENGSFICGVLSIADMALFPNLYATRSLGVGYDAQKFPKLDAWMSRLANLPLFQNDIGRLRAWFKNTGDSSIEKDKIFWRGERIEWLLASGFHDWFFNEIKHDRVLWPGK